MTAFGRVALDGEEVPAPSNGDDWGLAWHPRAATPPGQPHGANAFCVTADGEPIYARAAHEAGLTLPDGGDTR